MAEFVTGMLLPALGFALTLCAAGKLALLLRLANPFAAIHIAAVMAFCGPLVFADVVAAASDQAIILHATLFASSSFGPQATAAGLHLSFALAGVLFWYAIETLSEDRQDKPGLLELCTAAKALVASPKQPHRPVPGDCRQIVALFLPRKPIGPLHFARPARCQSVVSGARPALPHRLHLSDWTASMPFHVEKERL